MERDAIIVESCTKDCVNRSCREEGDWKPNVGRHDPLDKKNSPTKLVVHRFKIVSHVIWPIGNSFTINTQFITHLVNQTSLFHILIPLSLCLYLYFFIHFLVWLKNQNSCTKHSIGEVRKPTTEEQSSHHTVSLESKLRRPNPHI